jgi:hypothetical protein
MTAKPNKAKTKFLGKPVRKIEKFVDVFDDRTGKPFHVAVLECGHGVCQNRARIASAHRHGKNQQGFACGLCPPVEAPKPKPTPQQNATPNVAAELLLEMTKKLDWMAKRIEELEDVKTAPQPSGPPPAPPMPPGNMVG